MPKGLPLPDHDLEHAVNNQLHVGQELFFREEPSNIGPVNYDRAKDADFEKWVDAEFGYTEMLIDDSRQYR